MASLESFITAINQLIFYKKNKQLIRHWKFSFAEARILLSHSWPVIISAFIQMVYQKADTILIARYLKDMSLVGQYAAAIRVSEASFFIPLAICTAVFPGIINNRNNPEIYNQRLVQLYSLMLWSAIIVSIGGVLLGDSVISFLYKDKFFLAPDVFRIHIWITIPVFFGTAWGMTLFANNKQRLILIFQVVNLILVLSGHMYFIPRFGIKGAAIAIIVGYYLGIIVALSLYKPKESLTQFARAFNISHLKDIYLYWRDSKTKK
jgi:O-antigen/teichoic acid export membrane protein